MSALARLKRLARLCGWLWLSLAAMLLAACGAAFSSACKQTTAGEHKDAGPEAASTQGQDAFPSTMPDAAPESETAPPINVKRDDLWNVPCE
jgi:hypothetical protein